jgi:anti-sigma28 factor (negative regulator of flagellin synthesis)
MRVHDSNLNAVTIGTRQPGRTDSVQTGRGTGSGVSGASSQDRVSLSDLSSMVARASAEAPGRAEHIDRLAAAYKSGGYKVNAPAVSQSIVKDALTTG